MSSTTHTPRWFDFWKLAAIQAQNSFNEKGTQSLLIPLGVWLAVAVGGESHLQYTLGALMILPFLLFSPVAGWLGDRYCKTRILQLMIVIQMLVVGGIYMSFMSENLLWSIIFFSIFTIQAVIFSPAKKGLIKDLVGSQHIGFAGGMLEMTSVLGILAGQLGGFFIFSYLLMPDKVFDIIGVLGGDVSAALLKITSPSGQIDGWFAATVPCLFFLCCTVPLVALSFTLPRFEPRSNRPFQWNIFIEYIPQLRDWWHNPVLRYAELGIAYFWSFGVLFLLIGLQLAKDYTQGGNDFGLWTAILTAWVAGGVVVGGVIASILHKRLHMKLSYIGAAGIVITCVVLAFLPFGDTLCCATMGLCSIFTAMFLVPLNSLFLDYAKPAERGNMIAAGNFVDCGGELIAVILQFVLMLFMPVWLQFLTLAIMTLVVAYFILTNLQRHKNEEVET